MHETPLIGAQLRELGILMKRRIDGALIQAGIDQVTGMQGRVLGYISHHQDPPIFQRDLEEEFHIRRSTATGILQLLEKKGLLERRPVEWDARLKQLCLTPRSQALHQAISAQILKMEENLSSCLTQQEQEQFFAIAAKLRRHLEE